MDFIRKPEVLATANAVGTASIYFILSKRLNSLTDEMDEIDNHLTSSIKKISENSKSIQGMTETFKDVLLKFEDHRKSVAGISKLWKRIEEDIQDMNDRYDLLVSAVKELGGNVDTRRIKKKKKKEPERRRNDRHSSESESDESDIPKERKRNDRASERGDRERVERGDRERVERGDRGDRDRSERERDRGDRGDRDRSDRGDRVERKQTEIKKEPLKSEQDSSDEDFAKKAKEAFVKKS
jgi:hypothetical protein